MAIETDYGDHPYRRLSDRSVWRKAVAEKSPYSLEEIYRSKFPITAEDRIVTAGSCFAQHIARKLRESGFNFCDYEPAPPLFPVDLARSFNYGVYSARYCNIYTVRQMLQTFERAFGSFVPREPAWKNGLGFADPFRPALEPEPFVSVEDLENSRRSHLEAVKTVFLQSDVFIFTLGLTEAWVSKADGAVFPLCPGTVAGSFDESQYEFKNFSYFEIFEDLVAFMGKVRAVNPAMRFLLTVSPVPLTATKSDQHVLSATSYSKSVLRAVAGHLSQEIDFVDYFPSYELITGPSMRSMFFEPNMRSVHPAGVDYVMSHFFASHPPTEQRSANEQATARIPVVAAMDVVCEELLLTQGL